MASLDAVTQALAATVNQLLSELDLPDPQVQVQTLQSLARLGSKALEDHVEREVVAARFYAVHPGNFPTIALKRAAAAALACLHSSSGIRELIEGLRDPEDARKLEYMKAIAECGPDASDAVWVLGEILHTGSLPHCLQAAKSLGALGPYARAALPVLMKAAREGHPDDDDGTQLRNASIWALGRMGAAAQPAVPLLCAALNNQDLADTAAIALGAIGSEEAVSALVAAI